ncbi:hypothetical protein VHEMI02967 [[Torrubiella] hemipterigena]|uniref:Uncharacterized protein n=1 Tax=[Torrubiella] hemipterigena TaxID=1531966 RepID=A0A0A1SR49_9HYPO|nr:hypothetical protein VHEMI02967 [[Torrubiella] hemipterigena]
MTNLKSFVLSALGVASTLAATEQPFSGINAVLKPAENDACDIETDGKITIRNFCKYPVHVGNKPTYRAEDEGEGDEAAKTIKPGESYSRKVKPMKDKTNKMWLVPGKTSVHEYDVIRVEYWHLSYEKGMGAAASLISESKTKGKRWDVANGGRVALECKEDEN